MPETYGERLSREFSRRGANPKCEVCGVMDWVIADYPVALNVDDLSGNYGSPTGRFPAALVICGNCGNMRLHALSVLGMLPGSEEEGAPDDR